MTLDETIQKLIDLKLHALAKSLREMMEMPPDRQLSSNPRLNRPPDQPRTRRFAPKPDRIPGILIGCARNG